jgi:hypothetical protein
MGKATDALQAARVGNVITVAGPEKLQDNQNATKHDRFVRLATNRVNAAIKTFQLIGNLSNRGAYHYSDKEVSKIFKTLQKELDAAKARFAEDHKSTGFSFE